MKEKFKELAEKYPNHSSLILFSRLVRMTPGEDWNRRKVRKWFNTLVDKDDYLTGEKKPILNFLFSSVLK